MKINKIFYSVEGEGKEICENKIFIRLQGCNFFPNPCVWCDTGHSVDPREGMDMSIVDILDEVRKYNCRGVSITGGEPLLQQNKLVDLVRELRRRYYQITVETNCTIMPNNVMQGYVNLWNVSPKLSNSGVSKSKREHPAVINFFKSIHNSYFKFVISTKKDLVESEDFRWEYLIPPKKIILMPNSKNVKEMRSKLWLVDWCKKKGYRYSPRLQIILWGMKRGV